MAQTTATAANVLTTYLVRRFIPSLEHELQYQKFTTKATIPQGMGNIARFNVFASPAVNSTALTQASTTDNELTRITTQASNLTLAEYGEFLAVGRLWDYTSVPGSREALADRMSYGAARSLDRVVLNQIHNVGTQAFWCTSASNGGTTTAPAAAPGNGSAAAIIGAARGLRDNAALGFTNVPGHPSRHFAAIVSPKFELDMVTEGTTDRMTWAEANTDVPGQAGQGKWVNGFMGSVYGTALYRTQANIQTTYTNTADNSYMLAEGGVASVSIIDADPQIFVNTASSGDIGNPYRNRHTIAWHAYFASAIITDEDGGTNDRIVRLYSAAT
jgi:N4-gp56 family major capsid protein